ncbi:NUC169 domain-containing protein [Mycena olivaceomarginata]|nr:NUC169 domain-containing protein [Mycena olivaceomarginata]
MSPIYDSDSSTEDASVQNSGVYSVLNSIQAPNRVGDVPMHWYDDLPHVGYDMDGKKGTSWISFCRPSTILLPGLHSSRVFTPNSLIILSAVFDKTAQMDKPLSAEELDIMHRLYANEVPDAGYDPYEPMTEWFTGKGKEEVMPLSCRSRTQASVGPSKWKKQKVVMKIVRAIRQGRILPSKLKTTSKLKFYSIWAEPSTSHAPPLPALKPPLPTNSESYNPPEEYLPTDAEHAEWEALDPEDREHDYLPKKYSSLRLVPACDHFIKERFSCHLNRYLAPRIQQGMHQITRRHGVVGPWGRVGERYIMLECTYTFGGRGG